MQRLFILGAFLAALSLGSFAEASELEIQFLGLDLIYDGKDLYDAASIDGGTGDTSKADPLSAVNFLVDGVSVGTLAADIWADVLIKDVLNIPVSGGAVTSSGNNDEFGFDLLIGIGGLALNIDAVQVFYTGGEIAISGGAMATSVADQDLPFGLTIDEGQKITIAFSSANLSNVTDDGMFLTGLNASGTGNVRATLVPEPSAGLLLLSGCLAMIGRCRSRRIAA